MQPSNRENRGKTRKKLAFLTVGTAKGVVAAVLANRLWATACGPLCPPIRAPRRNTPYQEDGKSQSAVGRQAECARGNSAVDGRRLANSPGEL